MNFSKTLVSNPNGLENDHSSEIHVCSFCDAAFFKLNDLELHCRLHDKNKDFKCLLCKAVFTDLQKLKLHDLQHSLEEANEDVNNIDQLVLPFGYSACNICGEKFSCDEELVNHSVNHQEVTAKFDSTVIHNEVTQDDQSVINDSLSSDDKPINYPILRQKIIKAKNGDIFIQFTLLDHEKDRCEEFTRIIRNETVKKKVDLNFKKNSLLGSKGKKKTNSKITKTPKRSAPKKSSYRKSVRNAKKYSSDSDIQIIDEVKDDDSDVKIIGTSRQSKVKALKKKIWKDQQNPNLFRRIPLITKSKVIANKPHRLFTCPICKKTFTLFSLYKKHRNSHQFNDESRKTSLENICNVCKSPFSTQKQLLFHQKMHNVDNVHKCSKCKRIFYHFGHFKGHNCKFLPHAICKICQYAFSRKSHLSYHLLHVHNLSYREAQSMLEEYVSDKKIDPKIEPNATKKEYCRICKVTVLKKNFIQHLSNIHRLKKDEIKLLQNDYVRNHGEKICVKSVVKKARLSNKKDTCVESSASDDQGKESLVYNEDDHLSENSETNNKETKEDLDDIYQPNSVEKNDDKDEEISIAEVGDKSFVSLVKRDGDQDEKNLVRKDDNQDKQSLVNVKEKSLSKDKKYNTKKSNIPLRTSNRKNVPRKIANSNSVLSARATRKSLPSTPLRSRSFRSKESSSTTKKNEVKKVGSTVKKTGQVFIKQIKSKKVVNGRSSNTIKKATKVLNKKAVKTSVRAVAILAKSKGSVKNTTSTKSPLIKKKTKTSLKNSNSVKKVSQKNNLQSSLKNKSKAKNKPKK